MAMATGDDQWLKEDGYLNVDTESVRIVYHPFLNVILVLARTGEVKVLDVNSGVILQSYRISGECADVLANFVSDAVRALSVADSLLRKLTETQIDHVLIPLTFP